MLGVKTIHLKNKPKRKYWLWFTLIHQAQNWQFLYSVASQHILCCDWVSWHLKLFLFILNWYHTFLLTIRIYFFLLLDLLTYHMDVNVYMCVTCYTYVCKKTSAGVCSHPITWNPRDELRSSAFWQVLLPTVPSHEVWIFSYLL